MGASSDAQGAVQFALSLAAMLCPALSLGAERVEGGARRVNIPTYELWAVPGSNGATSCV